MKIMTCLFSWAIMILPAGPEGTGRTLPVHPPGTVPVNPPVRTWKFDLVPGRSMPGYLPVLPSTLYTPQLGYGFDFGSQVTGSRPFYFSIKLPEGNYNVTVTLGDKKEASITTIKAECRRLMVEKCTTAPGKFATRNFTVHVRDSIIHEPVNTLGDYPAAMRQTGKELNVAVIDLNSMSKQLYEAWGPERSIHAFVHYPAQLDQMESLNIDHTHK